MMTKLIAAIRLRGAMKANSILTDALKVLNLRRANHCVVLHDSPAVRGSLEKVKDFVTYGELSDDSLERLVRKRGRKEGDKKLNDNEIKQVLDDIKKNIPLKKMSIKPYFRLSPPSKGMKSVKHHFPKGDLGYRGDDINKFLERMI